MMLPCDLSAKLLRLFPLLDSNKTEQSGVSDPLDVFEIEPVYSQQMSDFAIDKTRDALDELSKKAGGTFSVIPTRGGLGALAHSLRMRLRDASRALDNIESNAQEGQLCSRLQIVGVRRELYEIDCQLEELKLRHISNSIGKCTAQARALLDVVAVMRAIRDGDRQFLDESVCIYPLFAARKSNKTTFHILKRFSFKELNVLYERGLAFCLTHEEVDEQSLQIESDIAKLNDLEQRAQSELAEAEMRFEETPNWGSQKNSLWELLDVKKAAVSEIEKSLGALHAKLDQLENLYLCRGKYYGVQGGDVQMFRHLLVMLDAAGVAILDERTVCERILKAFFRGHIEMLQQVGVLESLPLGEVRALVKDGKCTYRDFTLRNKKYHRISDYGAGVLKVVSRMVLPPHFELPKKIEPQRAKPRVNEGPVRPIRKGNGYKIIRLDQSIEFY